MEHSVVMETAVISSSHKKKSKKKSKGAEKSVDQDPCFVFCPARSAVVRVIGNEKGRALVATLAIAAGTLVFNESPFVTISHSPSRICCNCGCFLDDSGSIASISVTKFDNVCSDECASIALKFITLEIEILNQLEDVSKRSCCDIDLLRMVIRLLVAGSIASNSNLHCDDTTDLQSGISIGSEAASTETLIESTNKYFTDNGKYIKGTLRGVFALEKHENKHNSSWSQSIRQAFSLLLPYFPASVVSYYSRGVFVSLEESAYQLACCINVNAYGITSPTTPTHAVGFGLFPTAGLCINHDCSPNCVYSYSPITQALEYRAIAAIPAGAEVCVSYIDEFCGYHERSNLLWNTRYFRCRCKRCMAALNALRVSTPTSSTPKETIDSCATSIGGENATILNDLMLEGLACLKCGSAGVVCQRIDENENVLPLYSCLICNCEVPIADAVHSTNLSASEWTTCNTMISDSNTTTVAAAVAAVERWLSRWDPCYTSSGEFMCHFPAAAMAETPQNLEKLSAMELLRLHRQKQKTTSKQQPPPVPQILKLHPNHKNIIQAIQKLAEKLHLLVSHGEDGESAGNDIDRLCSSRRRIYQCMQRVLQSNDFQLTNAAFHYAKCLEYKKSSKKLTKSKDIQKEQRSILAGVIQSRLVCFGEHHPLTIEAVDTLKNLSSIENLR